MRDSFNAVFVEGDAVGELMFYGRGAGGLPDGQRGARRRHRRRRQPAQGHPRHDRHVRPGPASGRSTRPSAEYYLNLEVADRPGVLHAVAGVFGRHGVSASAPMEQEGLGAEARLVFITHEAAEPTCRRPLRDLRELDVVDQRRRRCCASIGELSRCGTSRPAGGAPELGFADVLLAGLATDGGLYVPEAWPRSPPERGRTARPTPTSPST